MSLQAEKPTTLPVIGLYSALKNNLRVKKFFEW